LEVSLKLKQRQWIGLKQTAFVSLLLDNSDFLAPQGKSRVILLKGLGFKALPPRWCAALPLLSREGMPPAGRTGCGRHRPGLRGLTPDEDQALRDFGAHRVVFSMAWQQLPHAVF